MSRGVWNPACLPSAQVARVGWWMGLYGAQSAKRQFAYSNSPAIRKLDKGPLKMSARKRIKNKVKTAIKTVRKDGGTGWCGTKELKATETLSCIERSI